MRRRAGQRSQHLGYVVGDGGGRRASARRYDRAAVVVVLCTIWAWRSHDWMLPCGCAILAAALDVELGVSLASDLGCSRFAALARGGASGSLRSCLGV